MPDPNPVPQPVAPASLSALPVQAVTPAPQSSWTSATLIALFASVALPGATALHGWIEGANDRARKAQELEQKLIFDWIEKAMDYAKPAEYRLDANRVVRVLVRATPLEEALRSADAQLVAAVANVQTRREKAADYMKRLTAPQQDLLAKALGKIGGASALTELLQTISQAETATKFDLIDQKMTVLFGSGWKE